MSHEEVVGHLLEYQFGRLPPRMNAAVEAHIRQCRICQRQGLSHASSEKRAIERKARRLRPKPLRTLVSRRGRNVIIFFAFVGLIQLAVIELTGGSASPFLSVFSSTSSGATRVVASPTPSPVLLAPHVTLDTTSVGALAVAVSADAKTIATVAAHGTSASIVLWSVATGKAVATLPWPEASPPGALSWSPDSSMIAAADGSIICAWTLTPRQQLWQLDLPPSPALRVYDVHAGSLTQKPDVGTAFADGTLLKWSAGGQVVSAPTTTAGASGVPGAAAPVVGLWRIAGSHLFADGKGGTRLGISDHDAAAHQVLLNWSPDGRYLLWASTSQPVALPAATGGATPAATAPAPAPAPTHGVPVPNAVVGRLASSVAASGHGDAFVWFAPDGREVAACDRSAAADGLEVVDVASGRVLAQLPGVCAHAELSSVAWMPSQATVVIVSSDKPAALYPIVSSGS
jgi:WD40 repeat protein